MCGEATAMKDLTPKQSQALGFIRRTYARTGRGPSVREIAAELGIKSSCSAQRHIEALIKKGLVTHDRYQYRSLRPLGCDVTLLRIEALERELADLRALTARPDSGAAPGGPL